MKRVLQSGQDRYVKLNFSKTGGQSLRLQAGDPHKFSPPRLQAFDVACKSGLLPGQQVVGAEFLLAQGDVGYQAVQQSHRLSFTHWPLSRRQTRGSRNVSARRSNCSSVQPT